MALDDSLHGGKYDLGNLGKPKKAPEKMFRTPQMTLSEIINCTMVLKQFTDSDHFKTVPENIREPITSGLKKWMRMFDVPGGPSSKLLDE